MKTKIILLGLLFSFSLFSKNENLKTENVFNTKVQKLYRADLGIGGIGVSAELPMTDKLTLESGLGFGPGFRMNDNYFQYKANFNDPSLYITIHGKFYYDREKRVDKGKIVNNNTGGFFGAQLRYNSSNFFSDLGGSQSNNIIFTDIHWGYQFSLSKKFLWTASLGIGGAYEPYWSEFRIYPALNVKFSYLFQ